MKRILGVTGNLIKYAKNNHLRNYQIQCARDSLKAHKKPAQITNNERKEICSLWSQAGFKGNTDWHKFYKTINRFDARYVPTDLYGAELIPRLNSERLINAWDDKSQYPRFFPNINKPYMHGCRIDGNFYDGDYNPITIQSLVEEVKNEQKIIVKPSGGLEGRGIEIWTNLSDTEKLKKKLLKFSDNYVIQNVITQHRVLALYNSSSVNPIRVYTLRLNNRIVYLHSTLRFGSPGAITDIHFENGKEIVNFVSVKDGVAGNVFYDINGVSFPVSKLGIEKKIKIPNHDKVIEMAIQIHEGLQHFDFVGSDITIDQEGNPVMIEYNVFWPGITIPQICNGPLFGKYTEEALYQIMRSPRK